MIDKMIKQKPLIWIAIFISLVTYMGWKPILDATGYHIFYIGMALFIHVLAVIIWRNVKRRMLPAFILLILSINNLLDELFYDPTKFEANEVLFLIIIIIYSLIYHKKWKD